MSGVVGEKRSSSLRSRILLAVALTVGFYTLVVVISVVLIVGPAAVWLATGDGNLFVTVALAGAGFAVLSSLGPAPDTFEAPGPELTRSEQPELHGLLDEVAASSEAPRPDIVFLHLGPDTGVTEHRGQRLMILSLPLMTALSPDEWRAVIAHEFGHFAGGDTRVGQRIWRLRVAIMRTVGTLKRSKSRVRRATAEPFRAYAVLFLRVTNAVARRAEFDADALSARVASPDAAARALRRSAALGPALDSYLRGDVAPMLNAQLLPPLTEGFIELTANSEMAPRLDDIVSAGLSVQDPHPYASHPTLRQRLEALGEPAEPTMPPAPDTRASSLLRELPQLERRVLEHASGKELGDYTRVGWDRAGAVHLAIARGLASDWGAALAKAETVGDAGRLAAAFGTGDQVSEEVSATRHALRESPALSSELPDHEVDRLAIRVLAAMVTVAAAGAGAQITAPPGQPVRVGAQGHSLDPFPELARIWSGEESAERWRQLVQPTGLAGTRLLLEGAERARGDPERSHADAAKRAMFHDRNSLASHPGGLPVSEERLQRFCPDLYAPNADPRSRQVIIEHMELGDSRAAVVMTLQPLLVAAYTDELDCVAMLCFPDDAGDGSLEIGSRLLTVNTYVSSEAYSPDLVPGPRAVHRYKGFYPIIADFITTDAHRVQDLKSDIDEAEWERTRELGDAYLSIHPGMWRDGTPCRSHTSATPPGTAVQDP